MLFQDLNDGADSVTQAAPGRSNQTETHPQPDAQLQAEAMAALHEVLGSVREAKTDQTVPADVSAADEALEALLSSDQKKEKYSIDLIDVEAVKKTDNPNYISMDTTTGKKRDYGAAVPKAAFSYHLEYLKDGVYLVTSGVDATDDGQRAEIMAHVASKKVTDVNMQKMLGAIFKGGDQNICIAPPQEEPSIDESYALEISPDHLAAFITLSRPEGPAAKRLDAEEVERQLRDVHGIQYGIISDAVREACENPQYGIPVQVAWGYPAVPGEDGYLEWHFNKEMAMQPMLRQVADDEKIDFKDLVLYEQAVKDQVLVTKVLPKEGTSGKSVLGQMIPTQTGKTFNLPKGRNTYITEDKLQLCAAVNGRVDFMGGCVSVSSIYIVQGNVDLHTGNVSFDGDICVNGNVMSDFSLTATGNIEVKGLVEAAKLTAGHDIFIRGGLQGGGKGIMMAKGDIFAQYVQYATVQTNGNLVTSSVIHCNVVAFGAVQVISGVGTILGGNICAGTYVAARTIGNKSNCPTNLEIGLPRIYRSRMKDLEKEMRQMETEIAKYYPLLHQESLGQLTPKQKQLRMEAAKRLLLRKRQLEECNNEYEDIKVRLAEADKGKVHVLNRIFPRVMILINELQYITTTEVSFATFRAAEGEVEFTSCRYVPDMDIRMKKR